MIQISAEKLEELLFEIFFKNGVSREESREIASHLVISNLMGIDSHGVVRAPWYIDKIEKKEIIPGAPIEIEKETPSSAIVNGNWGFGQTIAKFAMQLAIQKASEHVVSCVTVRQCNHVGRIGAYTSLASAQGMVGMGMANLHGTSHCVVPFGGKEARLPTNPISIAFPSGQTPNFLMDMTTSVVAEGKLRVMLNRGETLPEGWIMDHEGNPAKNPAQFYEAPRGAILPLGGIAGHKGFALSMAVDALSGALSGADCSNPNSKRHGNACFFIALRIDAFLPLDDFETKVHQLVKHTQSAATSDGIDRIYMPGEPEYLKMKANLQKGVSLDHKTWEQICTKASKIGIKLDDSPSDF